MPSNTAAWLNVPKEPFEIKSAPYTPPLENEIVVKNSAVAINPVDWRIQEMGPALFSWCKLPTVIGIDLAGEVVEVGSAVTRFKIGDRVLGHAAGMRLSKPSESAFQAYTILQPRMTSPIPDTMSYESACVLPLGLSTASCGLFEKGYLALQYPSVPPKPTGEALLIWGGATSVGSNAIQLTVAAGYDVITTASPKNFEYVKKLGAGQVFDYNSTTVVADLIEALKGKTIAGAIFCAGGDTTPCFEVVAKSTGGKFVACAMPLPQTLPEAISAKFITASSIMESEVGLAVYEAFLPVALAEGVYIAAPDPLIVGKGLEKLEDAFKVQRNGVSAKKVVVSL